MLYPKRGVSELTRFTPEEVEEKYGLTPAQYPDFAALRGDPSDNLPGIPGVGEKTAAKWIREFGSLTALVDRVDEVKGKAGDALREHLATRAAQPAADRAGPRRAAAGRPARTWCCGQWDRDEVHKLFDNLQFRVLRERLFATLTSAEPEAEEGFDVDGHGARRRTRWPAGWPSTPASGAAGRHQPARAAGAAAPARSPGIALAVEGGDRRPTSTPTTADRGRRARRWPAGWPTRTCPRPCTTSRARCSRCTRPGLARSPASPATPRWPPTWRCRASAASTSPTSPCATCDRSCAREAAGDGQLTLDGGDEEADAAMAPAEIVRARAVADLAAALDDDLDDRGAHRAAARRRAAAGPGAGRHGARRHRRRPRPPGRPAVRARRPGQGGRAGRVRRRSAASSTSARPSSCRRSCSTSWGCPRRSGSRPATRPTPTRWPGSSEQAPDVRSSATLLRHRDVARLKTVVDSLIPMVDDARPHPHHLQPDRSRRPAGCPRPTPTCRTSRSAPPRAAGSGRAFVVGAGYESLMTADYSQIEMRIMAHLSEDAGLIEAFASGEDLHTFVASQAFGIPPESGRPGAAPPDQGDVATASPTACRRSAWPSQLQDHAGRGPGADGRLLRAVRRGARLPARRRRRGPQDGYTETILGRRRYLPDLTSDNRQRREMAERMALNAPIQGSAADIIKVAMLGVDRALRERGLQVPAAAAGARRARARGRAGGAGDGRGAGPRADGRRLPAVGAARRLGRRRPHLGRRRPLTAAGPGRPRVVW